MPENSTVNYPVYAKVMEQSKIFFKALPSLLKSEYRGKYVVIHNGRIVDAYEDEGEAIANAAQRFGWKAGWAVHLVDESEAEPIYMPHCSLL